MTKSEKYYGLRLISIFCKALTIILVIVSLGIIGANIISVLNLEPRPSTMDLLQVWASESVSILLFIGGVGFVFFIISQIIDMQMAINTKLNAIADVVRSMDNIVDSIEALNKEKPQETMTLSQHQEIMQALKRQTRVMSKLYQDMVEGDHSSSDESIPLNLK